MPYKAKLTTRTLSTSTVTTDNLNKGSELTFQQADSNFLNLRDQTIGIAGDDSTTIEIGAGNTLKVAGAGTVTTAVSGQTLTITGTGGSGSTGNITFTNNEIGTINTNEDILLNPNSTGRVQVAGSGGLYVGSTATGTPGSGTDGNIARIEESRIDFNNNGNLTGDFTIYGPQGQESGYKTPFQIRMANDPYGELLLYSQKWPTSDGTSGQVLKTDGAGQLSWSTVAGTGTVTSITAGTGLTGGTITSSGTIALDTSTVMIKVVGDDSTGTDLRVGETIKIAGGNNITTSITGDVLTITDASGSATTGDLQFVGSTISSPSNANITLSTSGTGQLIADCESIFVGTSAGSAMISTNTASTDFFIGPHSTSATNFASNNQPFLSFSSSDNASINVPASKTIFLTHDGYTGANNGIVMSNASGITLQTTGTATVNLVIPTSATIGANGAASALTANPVGYIKIKVNGTAYQIPYYNI